MHTPDRATSSRESSPFSDIVHFGSEVDLNSSSCGSASAGPNSSHPRGVSELDFSQGYTDEEGTDAVGCITEEDKACE